MKHKYSILLVITLTAMVLTSCSRQEQTSSTEPTVDERLTVAVSILPQKTFIEQIAGDLVDVIVMVPPGQSPATFEPTTRQLMGLAEARVYFTIGVPFEAAFLDVIAQNLPDLPIVATDTTTEKRRFLGEDDHAHEDEDEGHADEEHEDEEHDDHGHDEGAIDPHIWMSPLSVIEQSLIIKDTLSQIDSEHADLYKKGFEEFRTRLIEIDSKLEQALSQVRGSTLLVYHPAFGYFADRYGLRQKAVEIAGKEPTVKQLDRLIETAREQRVKVVFVQPEFSRKSAEVIAQAIGAQVFTAGSLEEDYMENLEYIADVLISNLGDQ